jgi:hypothetical protein
MMRHFPSGHETAPRQHTVRDVRDLAPQVGTSRPAARVPWAALSTRPSHA